ncbi:branched-chain amino acid transport system II carrier protein, partial [Staphylococcus epidermidis]
LSVIYPVAITVILLLLIARFIPTKLIAQQIPLIIVAIESILSLITNKGWISISFMYNLPLNEYSLGCFPIDVLATLFFFLFFFFFKNFSFFFVFND